MNMIARDGWIEIICGGMFSGKSEELIRRIRRARIARQNVSVFKPVIDDRYRLDAITSHNGIHAEADTIDQAKEILAKLTTGTDVVAIDEVQFLDEAVVEVAQSLADQGIRVICAGLDQDFRGRPFGPTPALLAVAEYVTKLQAICIQCGGAASRTQRLVQPTPSDSEESVIQVGASEQYEARCRHCHQTNRQSLPENFSSS
ncbi:thymidine kinase [Marininema halotolerans]|uniref:Thymidine kinase n=1 Tax=Marininema halotolerans TaxID=1155944 RepID=A0A1I6P462_9BACL|nr:thymidine kinase [Marininema halotolerans]SFS34972.1 thymidine kinase [Marininema halotolerans]